MEDQILAQNIALFNCSIHEDYNSQMQTIKHVQDMCMSPLIIIHKQFHAHFTQYMLL